MSTVDFHDLRILLVDDDTLVRETVGAMLRGLGATVIPAKDGPAAIDILQSDAVVRVMLTDVVMPGGMDGLALAERASVLRPALNIVFMSGNAEADQRTLRAIGDRPLLVKPFRKHQLAAVIRANRPQP